MARPASRQKAFVVGVFKNMLVEASDPGGKFAGARVKEEDPSTLTIEMPSTVGPGPKYSITIREQL